MALVQFTPHLREFFPLPEEWETSANSLRALIAALNEAWPGIAFYITDEQGNALREHVAVWVNRKRLPREADLDTPLAPDALVHIMQALSGG
jgi:molybdopterin synthase sulfur carrier subunit